MVQLVHYHVLYQDKGMMHRSAPVSPPEGSNYLAPFFLALLLGLALTAVIFLNLVATPGAGSIPRLLTLMG